MKESLKSFREGLLPEESAVVFSSVSRRYLTGFASSDGVLFCTRNEARLYLDSRYLEMAQIKKREGLLPEDLILLPQRFREDLEEAYRRGELPKLLFEDRRMTVQQYRASEEKYPETRFVPLKDRIDKMREVKTEEEIVKIAAAQALAEEAFLYMLPRLEKGRSEKSVAAELEDYMKLHGASAPSFETICVSGQRSSLPHGKPTDASLEENSFLTMDFGCVLDGYASDMTRTVCIGKASDEMKQVYNTVLRAQEAALKAVLGKDVDDAARSVIHEAGYGACFGHSTGHGIGLEVHEAPSFSPRSEGAIPAGAVLSVEPGIYLEGKFGVRIEDLVVVREGGSLNLNRSTKELLEL